MRNIFSDTAPLENIGNDHSGNVWPQRARRVGYVGLGLSIATAGAGIIFGEPSVAGWGLVSAQFSALPAFGGVLAELAPPNPDI